MPVGPLREVVEHAAEAAVIMLCHAVFGGLTVVSMWALQRLAETLGGGKAFLIYDRWPLEYLFQTIDLGIVLVVGFFGLWEAVEVLRVGNRGR